MTLKRLFFLAAAILIAMPGLFAQEQTLRLIQYLYPGAITPSESDPTFTYNAETGWYEGVTIEVTKPGGTTNAAFKLYTEKDGDVTFIGPMAIAMIDFTKGNPYRQVFASYTQEEGGVMEFGSSGWVFWKFYDPTATSATVSVSVNLTTGTIVVDQEDAVDVLPEALYIWGSTDGGVRTTRMGELTPSEDNPELYTGIFEVPDCPGPFVYDDPEMKPNEEDAPTYGFMFVLSPEAEKLNQNNILRFGAAVNFRTVNMEEGQTTDTVQMLRNNGGAVIDQTPGKTLFSFDWSTLKLTLTLMGDNGDSGVEGVAADGAEPAYFNLQGVKVARPDKGIYIKVTGAKAEKVAF